jgi:hypothetical protein
MRLVVFGDAVAFFSCRQSPFYQWQQLPSLQDGGSSSVLFLVGNFFTSLSNSMFASNSFYAVCLVHSVCSCARAALQF